MSFSSQSDELPKGISPKAKPWEAFVASEVKTMNADNSDQYFLFGRSLFNKNSFNEVNDEDHDTVHGIGVIYGPFSSKQAMEEFVSDYPDELWPSDRDWCFRKVGKPFIISGYYEAGKAVVVHNKTLPIQSQLGYNQMQRKIKEREKAEKAFKEREKNPKSLTREELEYHIKFHENNLKLAKEQCIGLEKNISDLKALLATMPVSENSTITDSPKN